MPQEFEDEESPEERISSTLRWSDVTSPQSVTVAELDALIFSELAERWLKVARIVYRAFESLQAQSIYVSPKVIAARVRELAETGKIDSVGHLTMWRYSEVRLNRTELGSASNK
jgi:hypothetical protein